MSVASSASGLSAIRTRRSGSRICDESGTPLTPSSWRRSLLKPRRLQSAYYDEKEGVSKCRNCGWAYSHARPGARERREHKRYCTETNKVHHWMASADFRDGRTRFSNAEKQSVDDDGMAAMDQTETHSASANSFGGADGDNDADGDDKKSLERTEYLQERDRTHAKSLTGDPQSRSSRLRPSGVGTSGPVAAASEDAEVHNLGGIKDVNKLQNEKQAGNGSLQDKSGTSNEDKHDIDGPKMRVAGGGDQGGRSGTDIGEEGTVKETIDPVTLPSPAKNWEDWEDVVREENIAHSGFRGEVGDLPEIQMEKSDFSDVDSKKNEIAIEEPQGFSCCGHTSAQPGTGPVTQSLAERNWDDWDDVIIQSSKLFSAGSTDEDAAMLTLDRDTFDSRESVADESESGQRNNPTGPTTPDRVSSRPQDDSAPGRERFPVGCEFLSGVDGHLSGAHDNKMFSSFRAMPSKKAHDVGLVSSRSKSRRRMRRSLEKVHSGGAQPSRGRKAQTRNRSTISNAAPRCTPLRQDGECSITNSLSQGAECNNMLSLVPTPDFTERHRFPSSVDKKLVEPGVSKRPRTSQGGITESGPLTNYEHSILGFRSWKLNLLHLIVKQTNYTIICSRCESFISNRMRKEVVGNIRGKNAMSKAAHESIEVSDLPQLPREFISVDIGYDEWNSMSDSSSESENLAWKTGGVCGYIDYFLRP